MAEKNGRITGIFYYPVKSCRGVAAQSVDIGERGIKNDRYWVVANSEGVAITQREVTNMALVEASVDDRGALTLKNPDGAPCIVNPRNGSTPTTVDVWGNKCAGIDEGDEAAKWLSSYLKAECRLVRVADDNDRQCIMPLPDGTPVKLTFVDGCSFLVISEESLDDLNNRLPEPLSIKRFRPNIVVSGLGAFSEDESDELRIGDMTFFKVQPCERCVITTIDPESAIKGVEPLKTLNSYRRVEKKVIFGTYFLHSKPGKISVGDEVIASASN
jgi:uncharacterized protein YcbX